MENMTANISEPAREDKHAIDLKILQNIKEMKGKVPAPLRVMAMRPGTVATFMSHRNQILENGPLSERVRSLVGIGIAVAMRSSECIQTQASTARLSGASEDEIAQAILIASLMLGASPLRAAGCLAVNEQA
ncbi:MAG: carboxymuconolactone decarboxylase family protein [Proteobacteria bacterium]|nr:carboxymuconolactone decarboxylase family protein [Pseudomonadota bacterium]MBU1583944.1 carboxymuconolactone decarboxylase family protein [Pseudomonadota bacterium]MBU2454966.1 carboxymuconolactone decarboxylase family protein [Pseudomonadota bacterium]MBU2629500.1 carboxymuconolactone decarboxylase family protein [Pseudomonadota bacterium]